MIYKPDSDSFLLENEVKKYAKGKSVLDIGSGSGILAKTALESGAKSVLCNDIDSDAIKFLKRKEFNAIQSDLFSNIKGKFDLIVFNPPYLPRDYREDKESRLATTGGKRGDEIIVRFLGAVKRHLTKNGIVLIVISSLTPKRKILNLIRTKKMQRKIIARERFFMEKLDVWEIKKFLHSGTFTTDYVLKDNNR